MATTNPSPGRADTDLDKRKSLWASYGPAVAVQRQSGYPAIYDTKKARFFAALVRRRDNDFYRRGLAMRYALQFQEEGTDTYMRVASAYQKSYQRQLRSDGLRYKAFPTGGITIVVSRAGDKFLPVNQEECIALIDSWIASIPENKSTGGTRGFGRKYSGSQAKRRKPGRFLTLDYSTYEVAAILDQDHLSYIGNGEHGISLMVDPKEALQYVKKRFKSLKG